MRALIVAGAAAAAWSSPALAPVVPPVCAALGIPRRLPAGARGVAVTFDDGPHPEGTPAILELLRDAGARATFFLVGEQVDRHRALAAEIAAAGHAIALHGHRHHLLLRVTPRALAADLDRGAAIIAETTGVAPQLYRPPYGIFSPAALRFVRRRGWRALLWSRWGHDWRRRIAPAAIAREVTERVGDGDVLLLHDADHYSAPDSWRRTAAALPLVLETLAERGLSTVVP
ncbi:MAG: polysaccharide deacetylase family protein [Actinobacteria bacterium]|nr:MAG: polysaccharide deacetylase family protein [Actinomycetota bacterium]